MRRKMLRGVTLNEVKGAMPGFGSFAPLRMTHDTLQIPSA